MPAWNEYGALALELFAVESTPVEKPEAVPPILPAHLEYQRKMELAGRLVLAGCLPGPCQKTRVNRCKVLASSSTELPALMKHELSQKPIPCMPPAPAPSGCAAGWSTRAR